MRQAEEDRRRRKAEWHNLYVHDLRGYMKEYNSYRVERQVPGLWLSLALDEGLTFRHLRSAGYIPLLSLSAVLEPDTMSIDATVQSIARRSFPDVHPFAYRPYIFEDIEAV